jgi:hypothetical protein
MKNAREGRAPAAGSKQGAQRVSCLASCHARAGHQVPLHNAILPEMKANWRNLLMWWSRTHENHPAKANTVSYTISETAVWACDEQENQG